MPLSKLLTKAEAAELLRVHPDTVGRMIRDGRLAAHKGPGRTARVLIPETSIRDYLRKHTVEASA